MKNMLKRAAILLVVVSILSTLFTGIALAENAYVKTSGRVNVRAGAGLDFESLGTAEKDSHLTYLEENALDERGVVWYKVRYDSSTNGWVSSKYATLHNYELKVTATKGQTYVRDAANLDGKELTVLHKGESGLFLDQTSVDGRGVAWYRISFDGKKGWVSSKYTTLGNAATSEPVRYIVASKGQTNIRTSGNLDAEAIGVLPQGASATYLEQSSTDNRGVAWYRVSYNGTKGWVSSKYTKISNTASSGTSAKTTVVATGGKTNIRTSGNLDAEAIGVLPQDASAAYMGSSSTDERGVKWYRINYDGVKGWVSSKYTKLK